MLEVIFKYLSFFFLISILLGIIGHVIYTFFIPTINKKYTRIFAKTSIGIIVFTLFTAIYFTNGASVLIVFILIILYLVFEKGIILKKFDSLKPLTIFNLITPYILCLIVFGTIMFSWEALFAFKTGTFNFVIAPRDYHHYSDISESLALTGEENFFGLKNFIDNKFNGVSPYHYFELWFTSGVTELFNTINIVSMMVITFPIFMWVTYLGILSIFEIYQPVTRTTHLISLILISFGGFYITILNNIPLFGNYLEGGKFILISPIDTYNRKYLTYYLFVIASWLLYKSKKNHLSFISLLCLPIISIGSAPGILSFLFVISLYYYFKTKNYTLIMYLFLFSVSIALFYLFSKKSELKLDNFGAITDINHWKTIETYKTMLNIILVSSFQYFVYYLPFALFAFIFLGKQLVQNKSINLTLIVLLLFMCSILCWAFLYPLGNANQFFSNSFSVIFNSLFIALIVKTYNSIQYSKKWIFTLLLVALCAPNIYYSFNNNTRTHEYNDNFSNEVNKLLYSTNENPIFGGILFSDTEINTLTEQMNKQFHIFPLGHYTNYLTNKVSVLNLSTEKIPKLSNELNEERFKHLINIEPFHIFVENQKETKEFTSIDESMMAFIKNFNLTFIIARKGSIISTELKKLFIQEYYDELSGDTFYLLRKQK